MTEERSIVVNFLDWLHHLFMPLRSITANDAEPDGDRSHFHKQDIKKSTWMKLKHLSDAHNTVIFNFIILETLMKLCWEIFKKLNKYVNLKRTSVTSVYFYSSHSPQ